MRKIRGVDGERTKKSIGFILEKERRSKPGCWRALYVHNGMVMKEICKGENKSGLYGHMKMLIDKGKETNDRNVKLINEEGETIADEKRRK